MAEREVRRRILSTKLKGGNILGIVSAIVAGFARITGAPLAWRRRRLGFPRLRF